MKDSQIRVCGRAAQTDSGAGGAVMFGCLAAAAVSGGFMTAGARLLLNASAVTSALSSVSKLLSPAVNAAACILLTIAVSALIAPLRHDHQTRGRASGRFGNGRIQTAAASGDRRRALGAFHPRRGRKHWGKDPVFRL